VKKKCVQTDISLLSNASSLATLLNLPVPIFLLTAFVIAFRLNFESSTATRYLTFGFWSDML
jgi:hypothetical protein